MKQGTEYIIIRRIGDGGYATVYLGQETSHVGSNRLVALKCLDPGRATDPVCLRDFRNEARIGMCLHHPNIVAARDLVETTYGPTIVMDYVDGPTLRRVLEHCKCWVKRLSPAAAVHVAVQVADALAYTATCAGPDGYPLGLVHRDVKPDNIMMDRSGRVFLLDFGISSFARSRRFRKRGLRGTPAYVSPEQASRKRPITVASDVFSLGATLFEMLTCVVLFGRGGSSEILHRIREGDVEPRLALLSPEASVLEPVLRTMLAREPSKRFHDLVEVSATLRRIGARLRDADRVVVELGAMARCSYQPHEADVRRVPQRAMAGTSPREGRLEASSRTPKVPPTTPPPARRPFETCTRTVTMPSIDIWTGQQAATSAPGGTA